MYSASDDSWVVYSWPSYKNMLLCIFLYVQYEHYLLCRYPHVELLAPGVCVSSTLQDATNFPKQFYSLNFHPAVYENSSCDVSIPLPGLKTLLS